MTHHEASVDIFRKIEEEIRDIQPIQRCAEYYGELLHAVDWRYSSDSLGHEASQELYWMKAAADFADEKSVHKLQE